MQSKAATVAEYLKSLPAERRDAIEAVRKVILKNLDAGYREGMQYGMIGYFVPHDVFPPGYHCDPSQPLPFAALASQKQHMALYLMALYIGEGSETLAAWFADAWRRSGKKLDMGKACVRFRKIEDVPLEVIAEVFRRVPAKVYIDRYTRVLESHGKSAKAPAKPAAATKRGSGGAKKKTVRKKPGARPRK